MGVDQLPVQVREFANYLDGLLARLDQGGGWCGVFWQRDPEGMQACLHGREVPPWDVVEALFQDLAAEYGTGAVAQEKDRARALHTAALAAFDARPGSRDALGDRLDVMLREQRYAAERQAELGRLLNSAATQEAADALRLDLAWAHDDHERATARCAELRSRIEELDNRSRTRATPAVPPDRHGDVFRVDDTSAAHRLPRQRDPGDGRHGHDPAGPGRQGTEPRHRDGRGYAEFERANPGFDGQDARQDFGRPGPASRNGAPDPVDGGFGDPGTTSGHDADPLDDGLADPEPAPADPPHPKQRKRRRGSARFAGLAEDDAATPTPDPAAVVPEPPAPAPAARRGPRGARFAGAAARPAERAQPQREALDAEARQETVEAVRRLVELRREGRSGEAHALLAEAAYWPAARFPLLAAELQRAGLGADWATLLWEAASLPADRLVGAADALAAAGRTADGEQILRQGVARPAAEIGEAVLALAAEGRRREIGALLDVYVRVRTPEEVARSVAADPQRLVPLLVEAAQNASDECHWNLVHALRVAGFTV